MTTYPITVSDTIDAVFKYKYHNCGKCLYYAIIMHYLI